MPVWNFKFQQNYEKLSLIRALSLGVTNNEFFNIIASLRYTRDQAKTNNNFAKFVDTNYMET